MKQAMKLMKGTESKQKSRWDLQTDGLPCNTKSTDKACKWIATNMSVTTSLYFVEHSHACMCLRSTMIIV